MYTAISVRYNQPVPAIPSRQNGGRVSQFREHCLKIVAGEVNNAMLTYADEVQTRSAQNTCQGYIRRHDLNLSTTRSGANLYIVRKS